MRKVYTKKLLVSFLALCIYGTSNVLGQACVSGGANCGTTTQNFNTGTGGFNSVSFVRDAANGDMRVASTSQNSSYTLISPVYTLTTNGIAFIGFDLTGTTATGATGGGLAGIRLSIFSGGTEIAGCNLGAPTTLGVICSQISDVDLVPGTAITYRITFSTTNPPGGGAGKTLIVDDFSNGSAAAPLPVLMKSFQAIKVNSDVKVSWEVGTENNVAGYEVQRSQNGTDFQRIGYVNAEGKMNYTYIDNNPLAGTNLYRVVTIDNDRRMKYSSIVIINGRNDLFITRFPNPTTSTLMVQHQEVSAPAILRITSMDGRIVKQVRLAMHSAQTNVSVGELRTGNYIVEYLSGDKRVRTTFIKQ
jgi:hypothetical protein